MTIKSIQRQLNSSFAFAGFTFPKYVWMLPRGEMSKRLARAKNPLTGGYYHAPKPNTNAGLGFYFKSDSAPGLRFCGYSDEILQTGHTGWFTDPYEQYQKIRGVVFRLPHLRGFLAGWTMGKGMSSELNREIYATEEKAALAADRFAEIVAEKEVERSIQRREKQERIDEINKMLESDPESLREELHKLQSEIDEL